MLQLAMDYYRTVVDGPLTFRQVFTSQITGRFLAALVVLEHQPLSRPMVKLAA